MSIYTEHRKFLEKFNIFPIKPRSPNSRRIGTYEFNLINEFKEKTSELSFFKDKESFQFVISYHDNKKYMNLIEDMYIADIELFQKIIFKKLDAKDSFLIVRNLNGEEINLDLYNENDLIEGITTNKLAILRLDDYEYYSDGASAFVTDDEISYYKKLGFIH